MNPGRIIQKKPYCPCRERCHDLRHGSGGQGAYDYYLETGEASVIGLDFNPDVVARNAKSGRRVALGDAADSQTWTCVTQSNSVRLVLLAMAHESNLHLLRHLRENGYKGHIGVTAEYDDQVRELLEAGADIAYNLFDSAGEGLALHARLHLKEQFV